MTPRTPLIATAAALGALAFAGGASAATNTFSNGNAINPHEKVSTNPNPGTDGDNYPSQIGVHGVPGSITHVRVSLKDVSTTFPDDADIELIAPDGRSVGVMSDVGGNGDLEGVDLAFDDGAAGALPDDDQITSGTYKPTNVDNLDEFPELGGPSSSAFAPLNGLDPNGTWKLAVTDDSVGDLVTIGGGWQLTLETSAGAVVRSKAPIAAPDRNLDGDPPGLADPYPSTLAVSGVTGGVEKITVTLHRVAAKRADDVDAMLVAPDGRALILVSDAFNNSIDGSITFDDAAALGAPKQQGLNSTTFRPVNYASGQPNEPSGDVFPSPAPTSPFVADLAALRSSPANGQWRLFLTDDKADGEGFRVAGGWSINFTTKAPPPKPDPVPLPKPKPAPQPQPAKPLLTSLSLKAKKFTAAKGTQVSYGLSASAQVRFRVQRRTASGKFKTLHGTIEKSGVAGLNKLKLHGKIGGKRLKPGSYRLKATIAGSNSRKVRFRIAKPAAA
jgi:subtilisin-like proprotein convertase family protein